MSLLNSTTKQTFAASTEKVITAYFSGIKIYVNDMQIQPKDSAGILPNRSSTIVDIVG